MENLLLIFENISSVNRALIIVSGITIFWVIEGIVPFKFLNYRKWRHSIPNFLLTLTTIIVNFLFAFASSAGEPFESSVQPFARGRARWLHVPLAVGDLI